MGRNQELFDSIVEGNRAKVAELVQAAVDRGDNVEEVLTESMIPAMREIGDRFTRNEVFVPEMLISAQAMQAGLDIVEPLLAEGGHQPVAKVVIGTVKGDLHDIGKNLVGMMLKGAGYEVNDLGVDCEVEAYEQAVDSGAQVVLLSAMLTTTMSYMKEVTGALKGRAKILVGGAPVTREFADDIGADGYADDAHTAVKAVETVLQGEHV
jgi:5-methyltetrahydrofolate--homocysteine methyltransferase